MTYNILIETLTEIVNNEKINKTGLSLIYTLPEEQHKKMHEDLFYRKKEQSDDEFIPFDEFDVELEGIIVKFIKSKRK